MPERAGDLAPHPLLILAEGQYRQLENGDLVGQHEVVSCPAAGSWYALVQAKELLVAAQPQFATLLFGRLIGIDDGDIAEIAHVLLRQGVHRLLYQSREGFIADVYHV